MFQKAEQTVVGLLSSSLNVSPLLNLGVHLVRMNLNDFSMSARHSLTGLKGNLPLVLTGLRGDRTQP